MTDTKTRVRSHVESTPGVHFNAVSRNLDIATGQTQYHLRRLLRDDSIQSLEVCGRTHYFATGYSEREQAAIALLRRETTRELV
ncbi:MAG: winged helix-turn-helix transcriptional regulator, partial [Halobacteriota archaeon]